MLDEKYIGERIAMLRTAKNVSARDMSLSLGQSQSYINNIENNKSLPSMQMFLYICDYLDISPKDFFDEDIRCPHKISDTIKIISKLSKEQQQLLIDVAKEMK